MLSRLIAGQNRGGGLTHSSHSRIALNVDVDVGATGAMADAGFASPLTVMVRASPGSAWLDELFGTPFESATPKTRGGGAMISIATGGILTPSGEISCTAAGPTEAGGDLTP